MKFFHRHNILLFLIILVGTILRFLYLDKTNGLWYDELVSYKEAVQTNVFYVILYTLKTDVHFPLYQIFLHFWSKIFSFSDYSLRAFSAVCGIMTVITSYFIGKELKSKQTGLICASIFAVNSFLIFYSQEVRMYSFLGLLLSLYLLFSIKIKNDPINNWNYLGLILSGVAIINTYTISGIFVFAQLVALFIYLLTINKDKKLILNKMLTSLFLLLIICMPAFFYLYMVRAKYLSYINGYYCDWSFFFLTIQNWFTPVLEGLYNNPKHYVGQILSTLNISTFIFIFTPIILAISSIVYSIKKDKFSFVILGSALFFLLSELIAFKFTNFKILSRYTMVIVPNLLILVGYGFSLIDNKKHLKTILLSIFLGINLFYLTFMKTSAFRMDRGGFRPLAQILISQNVKDNDFVVLWNRKEVLDKYVNVNLNKLAILKDVAYTSEVILWNEKILQKMPVEKRKEVLRKYFESPLIPQNTISLINAIHNYMKPGQKFIITTNKHFDTFTQQSFTNLVKNNEEYNDISYNDLLTIKALIDLKELTYQKFKFIKKIEHGQDVVIVFEK